jgi:hypothetical protein
MIFEEKQRRSEPGRFIRLEKTPLKMLPWYAAIPDYAFFETMVRSVKNLR